MTTTEFERTDEALRTELQERAIEVLASSDDEDPIDILDAIDIAYEDMRLALPHYSDPFALRQMRDEEIATAAHDRPFLVTTRALSLVIRGLAPDAETALLAVCRELAGVPGLTIVDAVTLAAVRKDLADAGRRVA